MRAVLTAARPGLTASAPSAQDASRLAALRLAAYRVALGLLGPQPAAGQAGSQGDAAAGAQLSERQAAALVSVLDTELSGVTGAADLAEVGAGAGGAGSLPLSSSLLHPGALPIRASGRLHRLVAC